MEQTFTKENLTAYLYSEMDILQRLEFEETLNTSPALRKELKELKKAKQQFPGVKFNAPKRSLKRVLNYSRSITLEGQC